MDPLAHTLTGAALSGAGLRRSTPLATATLIIAANAPDIDVVALFGGDAFSLAFRRGWTHGVLAWFVLPVVITTIMLLYDSSRRRRQALRGLAPGAPARAGPLLGLAFLGVLTHPALDWLNTYGVRFFSPFSERWYYGDALFIVDPWLWLMLGGGACLALARSGGSIVLWLLLAVLASLPVLLVSFVPPAARIVWLSGIALVALLRLRGAREGPARVGLGLAAIYVAGMVAASRSAERAIRLNVQSITPPNAVMFQPAPADPLRGEYVFAEAELYRVGTYDWLQNRRVQQPHRQIARSSGGLEVYVALETPRARNFLVWARFPYVESRDSANVAVVFVGDARYPDERRGIGGVTVRVAK